MWSVESRFAWGEVNYDSVNTGTQEEVEDFALEFRALFGGDIPWEHGIVFTPYSGLGYRYLNDDSQGEFTTSGHAGYERESHYFYIPLGLETTFALKRGWLMGVKGEYDWFLTGEQTSHLADATPGLSDVTNDQDHGYGWRMSLKFLKYNDEFDVLIEPFWRHWEIKDSQSSAIRYQGVAIGYGIEPKNDTDELGANISVHF